MGRSRSRDRDRERKEGKDEKKKDKKEKDKDRKRSRSRDRKDKDKEKDRKRSRSRERRDKDEKKEKDKDRDRERERKPEPIPEPVAPPVRQRSPSFQYRRWRFDSPPKEEELERDKMLCGNPMGMGGISQILGGGGLGLSGMSNVINPMQLAQDTKASRELYVGNLPAGITNQQLHQFLNQVAVAVKVNAIPGEPIISATVGGGGQFAFIEFRTAEEAANGLRLNNVELLGTQLKVGRPKGYTGPEAGQPLALGAPGMLALGGLPPSNNGMQTGGVSNAPALGQMPGMMGMPGIRPQTALDARLCLVNIPLFVADDRVKELLQTFGQLKFFAMQKDEDGKSVGVAFFEYMDMMTQQQARVALEGLELGAKKLSVKKPEEVLELGLVSKVQRLGARVVPSKMLYLKNLVNADEIANEQEYADVCVDIRLEAEKFGTVISIEVPRPGQAARPTDEELSKMDAPPAAITGGLMLALGDVGGGGAAPKAPPKAPIPVQAPVNNLAIVVAGAAPTAQQGAIVLAGSTKGVNLTSSSGGGVAADGSIPGLGYAFIEFATIEGASKAKKALNGRKFGNNLVEAEYFDEEKYARKDFAEPQPNTKVPVQEAGNELALYEQAGGGAANPDMLLEEAPVMVE